MGKEIQIETGVVEYNLNGKVTVQFNPTDSGFIERLYTAFEELDEKQEGYKDKVEKVTDKKELFSIARERDAEMRNIIDSVFDVPVSEKLFGGMNVYALSGGLPVWCNLMLAIMDEIDDKVDKEQKLAKPRVDKYTAKYAKYTKKH